MKNIKFNISPNLRELASTHKSFTSARKDKSVCLGVGVGTSNSSSTAQELYCHSCVECTFGADGTRSVMSDKSLHEHSRPRKLLQLGHKQFPGNSVSNNNYQVCSSGGAKLLVLKDLGCALARAM